MSDMTERAQAMREYLDRSEEGRHFVAIIDALRAAQQPEVLTCDDCGAECTDPWHYSTATERHRHQCDACHAQSPEPAKVADGLRETLAEIAHSQWSGWMEYLFSKGTFGEDGTWLMPKWAVDRWSRQMKTEYQMLSDEEKNSDRNEADRFLRALLAASGEGKP
jgi:hypothetical protein